MARACALDIHSDLASSGYRYEREVPRVGQVEAQIRRTPPLLAMQRRLAVGAKDEAQRAWIAVEIAAEECPQDAP